MSKEESEKIIAIRAQIFDKWMRSQEKPAPTRNRIMYRIEKLEESVRSISCNGKESELYKDRALRALCEIREVLEQEGA